MIAAYRDRSTGRYPIRLDEIRAGVNAAFGEEPPQDVLDAFGVDPVEATVPPAYDPKTQMLTEAAPVETGGVWRQAWAVSALPPAPTPQEVTRRQAKIVLSRVGLLTRANEAIATMDGQLGVEARIDWTDASVFRRDNPLISGLGSILGLSSAQIDDLFRQAALVA